VIHQPAHMAAPRAAPTKRVLGVLANQALIVSTLITAASIALYGVIPESAAVLIVVLTGIPVWWMLYCDDRLPLPSHAPWALVTWALVAWTLVGALWSPSPLLALHMAMTVGLYALCVEAWSNLAKGPAVEARLGVARALLYIMPAIAAYVAFEALTGQWIRNSLTNIIPMLRPRPHHMTIDAASGVRLNLYMLNRNVAALMFLLWPTALIARVLLSTKRDQGLAAGIAALVIASVAIGNHGSSKFALLLSAIIFLTALWRLAIAYRVIRTVWTVLCLAIVPAAFAMEQAEIFRTERLPYSTAHRFLIWGETARAIIQHPIVGAGSGATRVINAAGPKGEIKTKRYVFPAGLNLHAHNIYLQTWFELGAIGAILLWLTGWRMISWVRQQQDRAQPYILSAFATGMALGSTSYAYNDPWFMASFGLSMIFTIIGVKLMTDTAEDQTFA
jgi:O-antigen ligase